jgi:quercetin dioxygenase-like cupin family protein
MNRIVTFSLAVLLLGHTSAAQPDRASSNVLIQAPLGDAPDPKMSLFVLTLAAGRSVPSHSHAGIVFAYLLEGEIENQVEPDPPTRYRPGHYFNEAPKQVHRVFRNLSDTAPARILVFQNTSSLPPGLTPLLQEPLADLADQEVRLTRLTLAPGWQGAGRDGVGAHQHPGPVFAYILKGAVENQVDPGPSKVYRAGEVFYEPPMHAHRLLRNASSTEPAELLIYQIGDKGAPLAIPVPATAQANDAAPTWETLVRTALPDGIDPLLSVNGLTMPAQPVNEHSHAGPVVGYILQGQIENQVEPDPPTVYKPGGFFYEAPRRVHKIMRNLSPEPATLVIFQAGRTGVPATLTKVLSEPTKLVLPNTMTQWQVPIPSSANQELRLIRLVLPAGTRTEALAHSGPGLVYVVDGSISVLGASPQPQTYSAGDLFLDPPNRAVQIFRNASTREPATLLLYHLSDPQAPVRTPPMMPYVAVHDPVFVPASDAPFVLDDDLVIGVAQGRTAKAYMAADLTQHGSVDDQMPDGPIEVTWCSACGTGAVFRAEINGRRLHFEYDSMVNANEVHKDRETGSRWQQSTGEAISGPLKGSRLTLYPFVLTTWKTWRTRYPSTTVLEPLPGYAERIPVIRPRQKQSLMSGEGAAPAGSFSTDTRLRPKELIAGLTLGNEEIAFALAALRETPVLNERVGGVPVVVVHQRSSDTTTAFEARVKGRVLRFQAVDADAGSLVDLETRSSWNAWGLSVGGPLKGTQLKQLILIPEFWFAWSQFRPGTRVFGAR